MKKLNLFIFSMVCLIVVLVGSVYASAAQSQSVRLMDVDSDGVITVADARTALRASAKLEKLSDAEFYAADINADNRVTAIEARVILRVSAKLDDETEAAQALCGYYFDRVAVVIKKEYSTCPSPVYSPEFFSDKYIASTYNFAEITPETKDNFSDDFQQIVYLYLKEPSRDNVLAAIEDIKSKNLKEVEFVEPDPFYYIAGA